MYFNFKSFLQMSLFIKQANLCLPTTKTTDMIDININALSSLFCLVLDIFEKSISSLRPNFGHRHITSFHLVYLYGLKFI